MENNPLPFLKRIIQRISNRRDKKFLRRLERILDENILETNILFRGRIGGTYNYINADKKRGYVLGQFNDGYNGDELAISDSRFEVFFPQDGLHAPFPKSNPDNNSDAE